MNFTLIDINPQLTEAWQKVFDSVPDVSVMNTSIFEVITIIFDNK